MAQHLLLGRLPEPDGGGTGTSSPLPAGDVLLNFGVSTVTLGYFGTGPSMLVDGVYECRHAVRLQIRRCSQSKH
jgi:hypothetical protein